MCSGKSSFSLSTAFYIPAVVSAPASNTSGCHPLHDTLRYHVFFPCQHALKGHQLNVSAVQSNLRRSPNGMGFMPRYLLADLTYYPIISFVMK